MKILKSGKEAYVAECNKCGCVFSYGKDEVKHEGPQLDPIRLLICPECHSEVYLPFLTTQWMTRKEWEDGKN